MKYHSVSINIFSRPNESPAEVLKAIKKINYPSELFEVILIRGNQLSKQRNRGIKVSNGEIIYLLDNDARPVRNVLKVISGEFFNQKIAAVGGPSLSPKREKNYLSQVIGYILETFFGAFRMRYRYSKQKKGEGSEYRLIGSNLALRKKSIKKLNGFDIKIIPNEETDLLRRLKQKGFDLKYNSDLIIYRNQRKNFFDLMKQFHYYGEGRMKHILKNPKIEDFFLLIPIIFFIYIISLFFFRSTLLLFPLFIYFLLAMGTSLKAVIKYKKPDLFFSMTFLYPIIHFSYTIGLLDEILFRKKNVVKKISISVKIVKSFNDETIIYD